jgi:hypothetical protein
MDGAKILLGARMIAGLMRALDNVTGRGEAAVTIPPLDGALRSNRKLDEAPWRLSLPNVDCLAVVENHLFASGGNAVYVFEGGEVWRKQREYETDVNCIAPIGDGKLAVALASGEVSIDGSAIERRSYRISQDVRCITAMAAAGASLYVANGSASNSAESWQLDLLQRNASGSIWQIELEGGKSRRVADGLGYPAGLAIDGTGLVYSEAWKHRLVRIDVSNVVNAQVLYADFPGYPGRLTPTDDGYWLAVFAPRSQLVEFVLREPAYRKRMVSEVPRPFWVAPKLRSGRSFYEPLQGGGVKHLGLLKPWAPTMSAGLCVRLDKGFQPHFSLHSRADGATHGVTGAALHLDRLFVAARGDGVVVSLPLEGLEDDE